MAPWCDNALGSVVHVLSAHSALRSVLVGASGNECARCGLLPDAERAKVRTVRVVNVFDSEMEEGPGRDGFWFRAAELGARLGAARIGATAYEARAGVPIWPYHHHYPDEEWLYVLDGAPVRSTTGTARATVPSRWGR